MKLLTVVLMNSSLDFTIDNDEIEIIKASHRNIRTTIKYANGKYILFICNKDKVAPNFFDYICSKIHEEFDCCFINYKINYNLPREVYRNNSYEHLSTLRPYLLEYLWSFMYKTILLRRIAAYERNGDFDSKIDRIMKNVTAIPEVIYYHEPIQEETNILTIPFVDFKKKEYYKNIIYLKSNLSGIFNGIVTWIMNIGKCFGSKYDITVLYDNGYDETVERLSKYVRTIHREKFVNYFCDRYISTYLDYNTPNNIFYNEEASTFIHGLLINDDMLSPDLYDRYIAVSRRCMDSIVFGFESDKKAEYIHNPVYIDKKEIKPHLRLVSTLRSEACKGLTRLEQVSKILDEEKIPYTWNVFTDVNQGTNHSGFIYRNCSFDIMPYVNDADYLVLLSDIESFSYSVIEALMADTKVVVTPVDVFNEIGVVDGENAVVIPFEYFEEENKEKLRDKVLQLYAEKNKKIHFKPTKMNYLDFAKLFKE